ncbi:hypothetical protein EJ05DRAFT_63082 [Pseudovirgaria hyperparasitica]|uniref:C2H2-type domain-containing protein n=1 Tax=Pseudovirgaria hyperparasitica TaxID=470096 RepID=A0A6A6W1E9_9PEZI|nr:uncharacterized protein EJ05DRAFT_63082 [Pseudovirgaria hyperparasitica]KAF2756355.1 hypothetical protein EJ05DRAFT_63082 [Pseudovirgaria hyperparasitica]
MNASYYSDEDGLHKSPLLEAVRVKAIPSPSPPPPFPILNPYICPVTEHTDSTRHSHRASSPGQADQVLLGFMSPDHPDIARTAATEVLDSASQPENDASKQQRHGQQRRNRHSTDGPKIDPGSSDLVSVAQKAIAQASVKRSEIPALQLDMRRVSDPQSPTSPIPMSRARNDSEIGNLISGVAMVNTCNEQRMSPPWKGHFSPGRSPTDGRMLHDGERHDSTMSSRLRSLSIPQAIDYANTLPPFQLPQSPTPSINSPEARNPSLPSFRQLSDIAEAAARNKDADAFVQFLNQQRASISSPSGGAGQSPTSARRTFSISSQVSPTSTWLPSISSHTSPSTMQGDFSPRDPFSQGPQITLNTTTRRPSHPSDTSNLYLLSSSSESFSPTSQPSPNDNLQRLSMDGMRPILPPPHTQGQQQPTSLHSLPSLGLGGAFNCEFPGCTAPPFQTQYLLNSHANVHSQSRPHYCPVPSCPRAEGGKGFKRKNEMIRHGLVHDSPGYVCPFCPDREHKYPRPDNLQR